jgi:hypothetical protein
MDFKNRTEYYRWRSTGSLGEINACCFEHDYKYEVARNNGIFFD